MKDLILILVLALILGGVIFYLIWAKRRGHKCIGCPDGCSGASEGCCGSCRGCGTK